MTPEKESGYRSKLEEALNTGYSILEKGGLSLDAVEATIRIMEDSELFNAGKGAVFTNTGTNELDASIMDGSNLKAGAVAGVKTVKNPISAARKVMEETWHVMLSGDGADLFAKEQNLEIVDPIYFYTQRRWDSLKKYSQKNTEPLGVLHLIKMEISQQELPPVDSQISNGDELEIAQLLVQALMRIIKHVLFLERVKANILFAAMWPMIFRPSWNMKIYLWGKQLGK
jgi:isoaspartyl peptidase/L-asparaginase-like protein (Ntn-hydrolase superfamily)